MSIGSVMSSNHLILCRPLLLPSIFPSIRVFSKESALHIRCPKYWSFSFNISPSNEHPGRISFRTGWLDLLAVRGTLKSLQLQPQRSFRVSKLHVCIMQTERKERRKEAVQKSMPQTQHHESAIPPCVCAHAQSLQLYLTL